MPLLPDNVNVATHLTSNISIGVRSSTDSTTVSVSIPAIAGGTAAGVVLAVVAVIGWKWWAFIVRNTNEKRSRKQNLLRRQSTTPTKSNEEPPGFPDWNSTECSDWKKDPADSPPNPYYTPPHQHSLITAAPALSGSPIKPPSNPACDLQRSSKDIAVRGSRASFVRASNGLSYKSSNISTPSVYSTQSGEEQQARVPAAVIIAALGHTFGTRRLSTLRHSSEPYTIGEEQAELAIPRSRLRYSGHSDSNFIQLHRISNISAGSLSLQQGSQSIAPIGVAYGGEECEESPHEKRLTAEGLDKRDHWTGE
ncbi:hypothetical protein AZE42_01522 [Rhizopogon vesiculosus]|uniref:Uncharacterized protein n=1 Tax=Rhizopogon vesiculosus TaxID=180088 RepID=A0A1J8RD97_9AGAM|nr:hypothetical protein AZE42_01522 [Rhizopogon vesiculosus]